MLSGDMACGMKRVKVKDGEGGRGKEEEVPVRVQEQPRASSPRVSSLILFDLSGVVDRLHTFITSFFSVPK